MRPMDPAARALRISLESVTARAQLLQRQILRADGLVQLDRDLMLGNVAAMILDIQSLDAGIVALNGPGDVQPGESAPDGFR